MADFLEAPPRLSCHSVCDVRLAGLGPRQNMAALPPAEQPGTGWTPATATALG
jgi:hypothetical protein